MAQISVNKTRRISIDARTKFLETNCRGVNAKLNRRLRINGKAT
jgi:hypothetical protein